MFVRVVPLPKPSSRGLLYVKCLWELSRYHSAVVEFCYMLNVHVGCPVINSPVDRGLLYVKCFVSCPVITAQFVVCKGELSRVIC